MNFGFSEEQELLRAEVRKFLDQNAALEEVRKWAESDAGYAPDLWARMAELGWMGLTMPEAYGGVGMDFVTLVVVLEETGRSLFPSPLISTVLAAAAIERAGNDEQKARWLPSLADGSRIGTLAILEESDKLDASGVRLAARQTPDGATLDGTKLFVHDAGAADLFVVAYRSAGRGSAGRASGLELAVLERETDGLRAENFPAMDLTKRIGRVTFEGVVVESDRVLATADAESDRVADATLSWLLDAGAALVTAEAVGSAEGALHLTTEFAKQRIQFGSPIGRYQGVKHPLAEMLVDIESFKSLVYYAAWALDQGAEDAPLAVSRAKAYASEVFPRMGIDGVGLHGGVGYTWEYDIQMYLKRSKWARPSFGDADFHYERIAQLGGL